MDNSRPISTTFSEISKSILGNGDILKLRVKVKSSGSFSKRAIDDFKVLANDPPQVVTNNGIGSGVRKYKYRRRSKC